MVFFTSVGITVDESAHVDVEHCGCGDDRCTLAAEKFGVVIGRFEALARELNVEFELGDDLVEV